MIEDRPGVTREAMVTQVVSSGANGTLIIAWMRGEYSAHTFTAGVRVQVLRADLIEAIASLVGTFGKGTGVVTEYGHSTMTPNAAVDPRITDDWTRARYHRDRRRRTKN